MEPLFVLPLLFLRLCFYRLLPLRLHVVSAALPQVAVVVPLQRQLDRPNVWARIIRMRCDFEKEGWSKGSRSMLNPKQVVPLQRQLDRPNVGVRTIPNGRKPAT